MASMLAMPVMNKFTGSFGERTVAELGSLVANPQSLMKESSIKSGANVPNYQLELGILSATTYPNAPMGSAPTRTGHKRTSSQQLFGGIMVNDAERRSESSNNSPIEERPPPKKKTRRGTKGSDDDETSRKQRGRPRLDTQDETAADRRRTQIRLAQRAYRHRKETTISALKLKVGEMEDTIEQMNRSFAQLHDNLFESGILASQPTLARQLKATTEQFVALTRAAIMHDSDNEEEKDNIAKIDQATSNDGFSMDDVELDTLGKQPEAGTSAWGYDFTTAEVEEDDVSQSDFQNDVSDQMTTSIVTKPPLQWQVGNAYQQFNVQVPEAIIDWQKISAEIERPLQTSGPYTYSFQETTFARRLHRMSLEAAYRNLTNPKTDPEYTKRAFKFTFCFSNRKRMLNRFQELLRRKAGESLENWDMPFFRIGGAGTHYPRRDEHGNPIYPPNMVSPARLFGPQIFIQPETPRVGESVEEMLENIGFGGEWFDSHDVEEYLKTKGIFLDGTSSFVDVDPSMISLPSLTRSNSSRSTTKTPEPLNLLPLATNDHNSDTFNDFSFEVSSLQDMQNMQKSNSFNAVADFDSSIWTPSTTYDISASPGSGPTFHEFLSSNQQAVTVDVNKFLHRMVKDASTCLGRAPGFRRAQVDNALALSLQEAF